MVKIPTHPAAEIFPVLEGADFESLVADIRDHGQREPVIMHDGLILDGRNRWRACQRLGIETKVEPWDRKGTPQEVVISMNLHRRHLTISQRAMIAASMSIVQTTQHIDGAPKTAGVGIPTPRTRGKAAALMKVAKDSVIDGRLVLTRGTPAEVRAVEQGDAAVSTVATKIRQRRKAEGKALSKMPTPGWTARRVQDTKIRSGIWKNLRDALVALSNLPAPADVVVTARQMDKSKLVETKLPQSLKWLKGFADEWSNRD